MTAYYELESIRQVLDSYPRMSIIMKDMIIESIIRKTPAADVAPVVHGQWLGKSGPFQCKCSVCGWMSFEKTTDWVRSYWTYCPNCGAKMDLEH